MGMVNIPQRHYHIIFNPNAGTALSSGITTESLRAAFQEAGLQFEIDDEEDTLLSDRTARALTGPADVVVAAGGDGTVLSVAEGLAGSDKILAILPLGTLNGLVRDLQLPLDLSRAFRNGKCGKMCVGTEHVRATANRKFVPVDRRCVRPGHCPPAQVAYPPWT